MYKASINLSPVFMFYLIFTSVCGFYHALIILLLSFFMLSTSLLSHLTVFILLFSFPPYFLKISDILELPVVWFMSWINMTPGFLSFSWFFFMLLFSVWDFWIELKFLWCFGFLLFFMYFCFLPKNFVNPCFWRYYINKCIIIIIITVIIIWGSHSFDITGWSK